MQLPVTDVTVLPYLGKHKKKPILFSLKFVAFRFTCYYRLKSFVLTIYYCQSVGPVSQYRKSGSALCLRSSNRWMSITQQAMQSSDGADVAQGARPALMVSKSSVCFSCLSDKIRGPE